MNKPQYMVIQYFNDPPTNNDVEWILRDLFSGEELLHAHTTSVIRENKISIKVHECKYVNKEMVEVFIKDVMEKTYGRATYIEVPMKLYILGLSYSKLPFRPSPYETGMYIINILSKSW